MQSVNRSVHYIFILYRYAQNANLTQLTYKFCIMGLEHTKYYMCIGIYDIANSAENANLTQLMFKFCILKVFMLNTNAIWS